MAAMVRIPHINWRNGRPRFEPGPSLRAMGYKGRDLIDEAGRWYDLRAAATFSAQLQQEITTRRNAPKRSPLARMPKASIARGPAIVTVEHLLHLWFQHPSMQPGTARKPGMKPKAAATIAFYRKMESCLVQEAPEIVGAAAAALDKVICFRLYEDLIARRSLPMAVGVIRMLSAAFSFGIRRGLVPLAINPCERLGMETAAPRIRVAEPDEISHLITTADALGRPEIGDAIMLGVWTAQRQNDRLLLQDEGLLNGRRYFRQHKTGVIVAIPESPILAARLQAMKQRRASQIIMHREMIINERDNLPWRPDHYRHVFAAIVRAASCGVAMIGTEQVLMCVSGTAGTSAKYLPGIRALNPLDQDPSSWLIKPMQSLTELRDQDLRDTAVTWLARAGCTIPEICAVTGHSLQTAHTILKHYLARHPEMADHAMAKLVAWHG